MKRRLVLCILIVLLLLTVTACRVGRCPYWNLNCYDDGMVDTTT